MSGALDYLKGDIFCPELFNSFPFTIECKHYKALNFNSLLTAKSNDIWAFWEQACDECLVMSKINPDIQPIVVFRWDRSKNFVMWADDIEIEKYMLIQSFGYQVKIGLLDDWLKQIKL